MLVIIYWSSHFSCKSTCTSVKIVLLYALKLLILLLAIAFNFKVLSVVCFSNTSKHFSNLSLINLLYNIRRTLHIIVPSFLFFFLIYSPLLQRYSCVFGFKIFLYNCIFIVIYFQAFSLEVIYH